MLKKSLSRDFLNLEDDNIEDFGKFRSETCIPEPNPEKKVERKKRRPLTLVSQ
jgi:hypothetical protein